MNILTSLKSNKTQSWMIIIVTALVIAMFLNGYLSAKTGEDNYLMNKII